MLRNEVKCSCKKISTVYWYSCQDTSYKFSGNLILLGYINVHRIDVVCALCSVFVCKVKDLEHIMSY